MTHDEALREFRANVLPHLSPTDKPAIREAWNNFTDALQKDGLITALQFEDWGGPTEGRSTSVRSRVLPQPAAPRTAHVRRDDRVVEGQGMGGFLEPPGHPEHTYHVETELRRAPANRGGVSLGGALEYSYISPESRAEAKRLLEGYKPPPIKSAAAKAWIQQILGYYRGMYRNPNVSGERQWHVSDMQVRDWDPMEHIEDHAGVRFIRRFYPKYRPTKKDFLTARWGA